MRTTLALAALALLAACNGADTSSNTSAPAAPVAAAPAPAGQNWTETVSETPEGGYRMGNPDAAVKLVEYGSRTCPACAAFARDGFDPLTKLVESGKVSFEFRDFLIHGAPDLASAVLGRCGGTAPFFPMLEQMYADQSATLDRLQNLSEAQQQQLQSLPPQDQIAAIAQAAGYVDFVKQRGISDAQAKTCLADTALVDKLVKTTESATEVQGTPSFFINGEKVENAVNWQQVEAALKNAGA
ncbi:thioredoxin domain-containing protein [Sphingomonas qomolangmaensis]|uniref:DsbA family protein n=1 Tax=Sphingomonas qomolangmaensis TaxID=2918765 RepID=A0ABY5L6Y0_9SPHN|nr:thioredoxin domain-containing protein [Sphingomonas qomolangmaensis]UUL81818.1 DsbA family protein [Sphingomonas qomolangmaensis]